MLPLNLHKRFEYILRFVWLAAVHLIAAWQVMGWLGMPD